MRSRNKWALGLAAIALSISLAACGGGNTDNGTNNAGPGNAGNANNNAGNAGNGGGTVDTAAAEEIYKSSCIGCHAADLAGGVGPNLQKVGGEMTVDQIHDKIANGGGGMPAFKGQLTNDEIDALTNWLAAKK